VLDAIEAVAGGASVLGPAATTTVLDQWRRLREPAALGASGRLSKALTPREHDVLEAMGDGLSAKLIAQRLGMAVKTVENHKIRVFDKLGVHTQAQAVALAIGHGMLDIAGSGMGGPVPLGPFVKRQGR
jgi:DNA-binding NarL/FixJ family response regulator